MWCSNFVHISLAYKGAESEIQYNFAVLRRVYLRNEQRLGVLNPMPAGTESV